MRKNLEECEVNMTPMIDVVFQLMIFFIVTIKLNEAINEDIILEDAINGPILQDIDDARLFVIEVDQKARITIHGREVSTSALRSMLINKKNKHGTTQFPVMIRADYRARHQDVRRVMDTCTDVGIWRLNFMAVKEHKATAGRHRGAKGGGMFRK